MNPKFQAGDMVRCVDAGSSDLKTGRVYTVCGVDPVDGWPYLAESHGYRDFGWWDPSRFELVPDDDSVFARRSRHKHAVTQSRVFGAVVRERARQDAKFGPHGNLGNMGPFQRLSVLTEEVGELAQALNDRDHAHAKEELVQVAAVAVAWLEVLEDDVTA